jgi:hypothetical protein
VKIGKKKVYFLYMVLEFVTGEVFVPVYGGFSLTTSTCKKKLVPEPARNSRVYPRILKPEICHIGLLVCEDQFGL